jgi:DNA transposition AAA+ family ATPase
MTTATETNRLSAFATAAEEEPTPAALNKTPGKDNINISADIVTANTAHLPEAQRYLVRWFYSWCKENEIGWKDAERHSTLSTGTLYKLWHDKYRDAAGQRVSLDGVCETLARAKSLIEERAESIRRFFVMTGTARKVWKICDEARLMQTIALIYGDSQVGKTYALEEYTHRHNSGQTIYVRMPAAAGVQEMMKCIAAACGIASKMPFNKLKSKVMKFLDHTKLIIIDEAHLVFETYQKGSALRCLETIRELHDLTQCGLVICATDIFKREIEAGEHSGMLTQFKRRATYQLQLPTKAPKEDWLALADTYKLGEPKGEAELLVSQIIKTDGLGKFCIFLRKASQMAGKRKERLTWDHFVRAHDLIAKLSVTTKES